MAELDAVKAELTRRVAAIDGRARHIAPELDAIRALARGAGLHPAATVARLLEDALSRGERGALVEGWLGLLGEAVVCPRTDRAACDAFAAACAVRFVG
jgi:hypothetical protein